jgi:hypothetical protein
MVRAKEDMVVPPSFDRSCVHALALVPHEDRESAILINRNAAAGAWNPSYLQAALRLRAVSQARESSHFVLPSPIFSVVISGEINLSDSRDGPG